MKLLARGSEKGSSASRRRKYYGSVESRLASDVEDAEDGQPAAAGTTAAAAAAAASVTSSLLSVRGGEQPSFRRRDPSSSAKLARTVSNESIRTLLENDDPKLKWKWPRRLKVALLTLAVVAMTVILLFFPEEDSSRRVVTVAEGDPLTFDLDQAYLEQGRDSEKIMRIVLQGSFMPEEVTELAKDHLYVVARKDTPKSLLDPTTQEWEVGLMPEELSEYFYARQESKAHVFDLQGIDLESENVSLVINTDASYPVPLEVRLTFVSSLAEDWGVVIGAVILVVMYAGIASEAAPRTLVTMLATTASIAALALLDERPSLQDILGWVDVETLTLLFSMMLIVSVLAETGAFDFAGYFAFRATSGRPWPVVVSLCVMTGVVSAFLDNVTTILLTTPVVIKLCEALRVDPRRVLLACVIFSNVGGAATAIGDPPNVLIASDPAMLAGGVTFAAFAAHAGLCAVIVAAVAFVQLRLMYGSSLRGDEDAGGGGDGGGAEARRRGANSQLDAVNELRHEILIWHRTAQSLGSISREEAMVRRAVENKIDELVEELTDREKDLERYARSSSSHSGPSAGDHHQAILSELRETCRVRDPRLLVKCCVVLFFTIVLFFLSNFPSLNLSLGWTALLGALATLVLADKREVESVMARVEWATLVFFATLFVVMEAFNRMGLLRFIGGLVESAIESVPPAWQLSVSIVLIVWVSGLASSIIDNIPFTTMMIPIVNELAENPDLNLPLQPLAWSLALGACLGGNGTLIGASANVVCAGVAEQHGYKISFLDFFKVGFPITLVSLVVTTVYLLVCHVVIGWNGETL